MITNHVFFTISEWKNYVVMESVRYKILASPPAPHYHPPSGCQYHNYFFGSARQDRLSPHDTAQPYTPAVALQL